MSDKKQMEKMLVAADQKVIEGNYWLAKFPGEIKKNHIPYDSREAGGGGGSFESIHFQVTGQDFSRLLELINKSDVRLFVVLLSLLNVLLYKYTGDRDITLGAPIYKQEKEVEFINTVLALKNRVESNLTFKEFLLQVAQELMASVEHQNYPMEALLFRLNIPYSPGENFPLFDIAVLLENIHHRKYLEQVKTNMLFSFVRKDERIEGVVEYNPALYKKETLNQVIDHFTILLKKLIYNMDMRIADVDMLSEQDRKEFLFDYNDTQAEYPETKTIHRLFEEQVEKTPGNIALQVREIVANLDDEEDSSPSLTFKELNEKANQVAHLLISKGVKPGAIIGIMLDRSLEMIIGILGILKAGAAYLPISPGLPQARKKYVIEDSRASFLLSMEDVLADNNELSGLLPTGNIFCLDDPAIYTGENGNMPSPCGGPGDAAYIIYTSGSTGLPKGVVVEHRGLVNYVYWAARQYVKEDSVTFPLYTSFAFDLTVTSIYTPLITGNTMLIYKGDERDFLIEKVLRDNRANVIKLTPAHLKLIRDRALSGMAASLATQDSNTRRFILGGENLPGPLAAEIHDIFNGQVEIYNEYGPTETVVGSMIYKFDPGKDGDGSVPIGSPIANTQIYILDENLQPVPAGVSGEIFISGAGVGRGYLKRPELTAEKYLDHPFIPGTRMYATGDLARRKIGGNIEFLGRKDQQVKIRGFRIEPGEIESVLKNYRRKKPYDLDPVVYSELQSNLKTVRRCQRCLLPETYPNIHFDEAGVCGSCRQYDDYKEEVTNYFKNPTDFEQLIESSKKDRQSQYDCLLLFSGGKDSTFVLYKLIDMGLNVLTYTFDNGYISDAAFANIKRITSLLGVDHITGRAEHMDRAFVESLNTNHNVCHGCWNALNTYGAQLAYEKGINLIVSGLSRGQIFEMRLAGLFEQGIFSEAGIEENLLLFRKNFHSKSNKFLKILDVELPGEVVEQIQFIDFFRYFDTPTKEVRAYLDTKGWVQPTDTGFCSSNCLINDVGIYVFVKERGYHFYDDQLSWDVRLGVLSREQGLKEVELESDPHEADRILRQIGYYDSPIKEAVVIDREAAPGADIESTSTQGGGNRQLYAYIETDEDITVPELRNYLEHQLPEYMIPSNFIKIDKLPLTPAGKIDRRALEQSAASLLDSGIVYVAPRNDMEKSMALVCQDVLKVEKIGIYDNFFSHGATSFSIIQLSSKLQELFKKEIPVITLFEYPTIASFITHLQGDDAGDTASAAQEDKAWVDSKKQKQDKLKRIRNKRKKGVNNE